MAEEPKDPIGWEEALGEHASNPSTPRLTGESLPALGRVWTVSPDEARIKAQFESWCKQNVLMLIYETEQINPDEAEKMRATYLRERAAGFYTWDGRACRVARSDFPGIQQLIFLFLRRCHPEMTQELAHDICRDNWQGSLLTLKAILGKWHAPRRGQTLPQNPSGVGGEAPPQQPQTTQTTASPVVFPVQSQAGALPYTEEDVRRALEMLREKSPASKEI